MQINSPMDLDDQVVFNAELATPAGYQLGCAVGTTFSLDFDTALSIPVSLALSGAVNRDELINSPLSMFSAMQKLVSKLFLFVEAGNISVPAQSTKILFTMLEPVIHEVIPNKGSSFHPKVWMMRYEPVNPADKVRLKLIVMSRNLTRDRSWDASLVLDGYESGKPDDNQPLIELLNLLIENGKVSKDKALSDLEQSLAKAKWDRPSGFDRLSFNLHNGRPGQSWSPPKSSDRLAVVSPFIKADALKRLATTTKSFEILISREDQLQANADSLPEIEKKKVLRTDAVQQSEDDNPPQQSGLHAKIYVAEKGTGGKWRTWLTIGSGNATNAGLSSARNIEFFATLSGLKERVGGIEQILGPRGLGQLTEQWTPSDEVQEQESSVEQEMRAAQQELVRSSMMLNWAEVEDGWKASLAFASGLPPLPKTISLSAGLVTFKRSCATPIQGNKTVLQPSVILLVDVTSFVRILLRHSSGETKELVLKVLCQGLPTENRMDAIIADVFKGPALVLRFIRLMLGEKNALFDSENTQSRSRKSSSSSMAYSGHEPMFEVLLRAWLKHDPAVDQIGDVIKRLRASGHDENVPNELGALWDTMLRARPRKAKKP